MSKYSPRKPTFQELKLRIEDDIKHYGPTIMPERATLVWQGYLGALLEWSFIPVYEYDLLIDLLPRIEDNPVIRIFTGWEDEDER